LVTKEAPKPSYLEIKDYSFTDTDGNNKIVAGETARKIIRKIRQKPRQKKVIFRRVIIVAPLTLLANEGWAFGRI